MTDVARTLMFVALMARCSYLALRWLRGAAAPRVELLAALTLMGTLAGTTVLYRYNPTSIPSFPLLPFVAIVSAGLWRAACEWLAPRAGARVARLSLIAGFSAFTLAMLVVRWPAAFEFAMQRMGIPSFSDQRYATEWLLDHQVTEPMLLNYHENGVLEFLSHGRIRPTYLNERQCDRIDRDGWERILAATRDRHVDILVSSPYFVEHQLARRCNVGAAEDLAAILRSSGRSATETRLSTPGHTWDFLLFSVSPTTAAGQTAPEPASRNAAVGS